MWLGVRGTLLYTLAWDPPPSGAPRSGHIGNIRELWELIWGQALAGGGGARAEEELRCPPHREICTLREVGKSTASSGGKCVTRREHVSGVVSSCGRQTLSIDREGGAPRKAEAEQLGERR